MSQPFWAPEYDVSADEARALIAAQFPHVSPCVIERFGAGMDNIAFLVDKKYVFRFPRRSIIVPLLETETAVLPLIAPHLPVPVPVPRFRGIPQGAYPWMFAGYELLPGTTACSVALTDDARLALAPALGSFLRALHSIDPADALALGLPFDTLGRLDHTRRFPLAEDRFANLEARGYLNDVHTFLQFMRETAPRDLVASVIVHGDLYARHVLVDESECLSGIIDWGDVHYGHPAADLMVAHTMLPPSAHQSFIYAYGGVDERAWDIARYRAIYHSALVADYGIKIEDAALRDAGIAALERIREAIAPVF